jgi:hypothetical protein
VSHAHRLNARYCELHHWCSWGRAAKKGDGMSESQDRIEAIGNQLREKIRSKFQSSTFLAGFSFTVLSVEISMLWSATEIPRLLPLSIPLILAAICLFVTAALKLDILTMPKRFWKEDPGETGSEASRLAYLADQNLWQIQRRMIFHWTWLTVVATFVTAVSLVLVLLPIDSVQRSNSVVKETFETGIVVLGAAFVYILVVHALEKLFQTNTKLNPLSRNPWKPLFREHD